MTDDPYPAAFLEGLDDIGADADSADVLDFVASDGLPVGDDRKRFQQGPGIALRALLEESIDPFSIILTHLELVTAGQFAQFHGPPGVVFLECNQALANEGAVRVISVLAKQRFQAIEVEGAVR